MFLILEIFADITFADFRFVGLSIISLNFYLTNA